MLLFDISIRTTKVEDSQKKKIRRRNRSKYDNCRRGSVDKLTQKHLTSPFTIYVYNVVFCSVDENEKKLFAKS